MIERERTRRIAVAAVVLIVAAACGTTSTSPTAGAPGATTPSMTGAPTQANGGGAVSGEIFVSGSSTVQPISQAVSEAFKAQNPDFGFVVEGPGTTRGFEEFFCTGESDVADASRPIDEDEIPICEENGVDFVELKVGYDGITVFTHPDAALTCLNLNDLYALFGPESNEFTTWDQAQALAQELGSTTQLPTGNLAITAPGDESGTYDSFAELVIDDIAAERGQEEGVLGTHYQPSPDDNVTVENVSGTPNSLGFAGFAFYENNADRLKALEIDAGEGCVAPSNETISDGSFGISRPLFIYPNLAKAAENDALVAWVDFYLSDEGIANVAGTGYVDMPTEELEASRQAWEDAKP